jgi:peptide/nickel transport system permease protein
MGIGVVIALPLGVLAAVKRGTPLDRITQAFAVMGMAAPAFWVGLVLMQVISVQLGLLPVSGMGGPKHYILPAFTLGVFLVAGYVRLLRSGMLDVLDSEYVKLARIKGLSERVVVWKHAFRNALIPVLSFGGVYFAILIGGAIIVETVFTWPGVGRLTYEAVINRDYPVLQAAVLLQASFIMVLNIVVDILYAYIDPRIRYG